MKQNILFFFDILLVSTHDIPGEQKEPPLSVNPADRWLPD